VVEHFEEERRALEHGEALGQRRWQARNDRIQDLWLVHHHQFDEGHRRVHLVHAAIRQRHA